MGKRYNFRKSTKNKLNTKLKPDLKSDSSDAESSGVETSDVESGSEILNADSSTLKLSNAEYQKLLKIIKPSKFSAPITIHTMEDIASSDDEDYVDESEDTYDDEEDEDEEEDEEEDEDSIKVTGVENSKKNKKRVLKIFVVDDKRRKYDKEYEDDYSTDENEDDYPTDENEDDSLSDNSDEIYNTRDKTELSKINTYINLNLTDAQLNILSDSEKEFWKILNNFIPNNIENKENASILSKCISTSKCIFSAEVLKREKQLEKKKERNYRIYRKISTLNKNSTYNVEAHFETLSSEEQNKLIKKMREINSIENSIPYKFQILNNNNIPMHIKSIVLDKLARNTDEDEQSKMKYWLDTFIKIPFGVYKQQPITIADGPDACHKFMYDAHEVLNSVTHGLDDAKLQILQYLGQLVSNPDSLGSSIAIQGPMGTGKTTLVREGISKILNRPFGFIALGGATDSSFLEGHSYTYVGSMIGKILQIVIESKCMNPVIYFDELDKISGTPHGEEITGVLTHLTDISQNSQFHDKYFSEFDFDLSKCLFIFSYNDESKVNPILKDRMYHIQTQGYNRVEKTTISQLHLLPNICQQVNLEIGNVIISDEIIHYIIDHYCVKQFNTDELGVRNLKRFLENIYSKINLYRLIKAGTSMCGNISFEITFPFVVTRPLVDVFIKNSKKDLRSEAYMSMYN